ncbi:MAG: thioesterase family protein [Ilumatobacteraceae bacterium]
MTGMYELATAVRRVGDGRFEADVQPGWDIGGNANGGYLLGIAGRAMAEAVGRPPLTVTAHYLAPAPAGPCRVDVQVVRSGRRLATATASLWQGDRQIMQLLGTFGEQQPAFEGEVPYIVGAPPVMPSFEESTAPPPLPDGEVPAIFGKLGIRMRPGDAGFRDGVKSGRAEIGGWFSFADERPVDAIGLLFVADSFPPPVFNTDHPVAWVPTVELTVHVRGVPAPGPLRCEFRSRFIQAGLLEEDGEIWDSTDHLVAQSRQLALVPRPS